MGDGRDEGRPRVTRAARDHVLLIGLLQGADPAARTMVDEARALMRTEDAAEGLRSFVERRSARYRGR